MLAALTLTLLLHTRGELAVWQQDWVARATPALTIDLLDEWRSMRLRHPAPPVIMLPPQPRSSRAAAGVEQWRTLVGLYFPAENISAALTVMNCESRGDPNADNPRSTASGLFQFLSSTWAVTPQGKAGLSVWDADANVAAAAWLSKGGTDWAHWVCKP